MKKALFLLLFAVPGVLSAQDTTSTSKISHEIGVNSILLIKQIISNNPSQTLSQLPYQVIYTMNIGPKFGGRAGLGISQSRIKTKIEGQLNPRTTDNMSIASRLGANMNFVNHKKITANVFIDGIFDYSKTETVTITDFSGFQTVKDEIKSNTTSFGGQAGFGVKYSFNKHIALYTEVPLQVKASNLYERHTQTVTMTSGGVTSTQDMAKSDIIMTSIFLPTTLFLTIMF